MPELIPLTLMVFYLIPSLVAASRSHDMLIPITIANIVFGWTVVGWFALLFVAMVSPVDGVTTRRRS